jgi:hypothetical protein
MQMHKQLFQVYIQGWLLHSVMNFADIKADLVSAEMKLMEFVPPSNSVCVSHNLEAVLIGAVLSQ